MIQDGGIPLQSNIVGIQADRTAQGVARLAEQAREGGAKAKDVPEQFSKLLATMLVKEMRQALPEGFFGGGAGADIFEGWLDEHVGAALAARDGLHMEALIESSVRVKVDAAKAKADATTRANEVKP